MINRKKNPEHNHESDLIHCNPHKLSDYWRKFYEGARHKMSTGAEHIHRIMTWGHGEQWRRGREKKK